jgi:outer membrane biosynthesis protein TonB
VRLSTLAGVTSALRTMARPLIVRRKRRVALPTAVPGAHVSVIATSALTSAGVSLLTMWLWSQVLAPESRSLPAVPSASAHSPALLEDRLLEAPRALTAVAASQQPHTPTLPLPTPVVAVVTKPTPLAAARQAPAAVPSPAKPRPPVPAPVKHASIARPAAPAPVAALPQTSAGATADSDHSARATGTSGASGLLVITEPEGARVTINGVGWGTTPVAIPYLPSGSKRVRVTKSGYDSEERLVEPGSAPTGATLRIELRESSAGRLPQ